MATKKTPDDANGHDDDDNVVIPPPSGPVGAQLSNEELLARQREVMEQRRETAKAKEAADSGEPPPAPAPKKKPKSRTETLYQGAKDADGNEKPKDPPKKKEKGEEEDDDDNLVLPGYASVNALGEEEGEDDPSEEGDQKEGEETAPPKKKEEPEPDVSKESNIVNLRKMATTYREERNSYREKIAHLEEQVKTKPSSEALQRENAALKQRITELEPFQLTFGLHQHPAYRERKEKENGVVSEMTAIAKDYDVEEATIGEFVSITNRKDRDEFLRKHFESEDARQELKTLHQRLDGMVRERAELEKKPAETLQKLEEQRIAQEQDTAVKREVILSRNKEDGWALAIDAATKLPDEQRIYELIEVPGNKKHNEKVVRPTFAESRRMVDAGLGHIEKMIQKQAVPDRNFVRWFTGICQQAAAASMIHATRLGLYEKVRAYEEKETKRNGYARPGLEPPSRSHGAEKEGKKKGQTTAAAIFESVKRQTEGH